MCLARLLSHMIKHALKICKFSESCIVTKALESGRGLVVGSTFFRVAQHAVSFIDLLELCSIAAAIGMMPHGQFTEGLAYVIVRGGARHTKYLIIVFHSSSIAAKDSRVKVPVEAGAAQVVHRWVLLWY